MDKLTDTEILAYANRLNEAYAVRHALPVERRYSDRELQSAFDDLAAAEWDMENLRAPGGKP